MNYATSKLTTSELYIRRSLMSDIGGLTISPMYSIIYKSKVQIQEKIVDMQMRLTLSAPRILGQ